MVWCRFSDCSLQVLPLLKSRVMLQAIKAVQTALMGVIVFLSEVFIAGFVFLYFLFHPQTLSLCVSFQHNMPFWRISSHSDLMALHHALDLEYL